ncbi:MAG: ABC transporter substrate-binding protein [Dehalococcoidia bacterium]
MHAAGLVHRDVKPANIMLVPRTGPAGGERLVLMDLGIARQLDGPNYTSKSVVMLSAESAAPEQIQGQPVGPAADVCTRSAWSHSSALAGRLPFTGSVAQLLHGHRASTSRLTWAPSALGCPGTLVAVVAGALAATPTARPASAGAFAVALRHSLAGAARAASTPVAGTLAQTIAVSDRATGPAAPGVGSSGRSAGGGCWSRGRRSGSGCDWSRSGVAARQRRAFARRPRTGAPASGLSPATVAPGLPVAETPTTAPATTPSSNPTAAPARADRSAPALAPALVADRDLTLVAVGFQGARAVEMEFNAARRPLDDRRVRQALAVALDPQEVARLTATMPRPTTESAAPQGETLRFDPNQARQLLAAAGFAGGLRGPGVDGGEPRRHRQVAGALQKQWAAVGVEVSISLVTMAEALSGRAQRSFDILMRF